MDASAIALARDNNLPIVVFSLKQDGAMTRVLFGEGRYTVVGPAGGGPAG
jgi:uridylate kinase